MQNAQLCSIRYGLRSMEETQHDLKMKSSCCLRAYSIVSVVALLVIVSKETTSWKEEIDEMRLVRCNTMDYMRSFLQISFT